MTVLAKMKIGVICAAAILFVCINLNRPAPKDPRQVEFEKWLHPIEEESNASSGDRALQRSPIQLHFVSEYPEFLADWKFVTSGDPDGDNKIVRILELAREGEVFALAAPQPPPGEPSMQLVAERNGKSFSSRFSRSAVEKNLQLQSMIKLLEIYSGEQQSPPSLSQP